MREGHAALDQRIEVRRLEQRMAERAQPVRAMVVRVDVQDVGLGVFCGCQSGERNEPQDNMAVQSAVPR
jgi:hypothetical protein